MNHVHSNIEVVIYDFIDPGKVRDGRIGRTSAKNGLQGMGGITPSPFIPAFAHCIPINELIHRSGMPCLES